MASSPAGPVARRVFLAGIVAQVAIVVTGGLVRLTGSGLGCPTWPECAPGSYVPVAQQAEGFHAVIEFGNRLLTFVVGLVILAGIVAALRVRPFRRSLFVLACVQLLGVVGQAILGGITVLTDLHPAAVASHFLLSGVLIAAATLLYERSGEGDGPSQPLVRSEVRWLSRALLIAMAAVVVVGTVVTGSGPHAGDLDARRFGLDPRTVSWLHADLVLLFLGLVVAVIVALRCRRPTRAPAGADRARRRPGPGHRRVRAVLHWAARARRRPAPARRVPSSSSPSSGYTCRCAFGRSRVQLGQSREPPSWEPAIRTHSYGPVRIRAPSS